jgi:uncharacterized protein (TIGR03083 family)
MLHDMNPVDVLDLFAGERSALLELLGELSEVEWAAPTACAGWSVKDVALHLLGDDVGRLSGGRDGFTNPSFGGPDLDLAMWSGLIEAINRQNDAWVAGTRRISPRLLIDLLRLTGNQTEDQFRSLDLMAMGMPVDWAGSEPAPVWLDVAREYTERWVHQQHIRDAVGRPGLKERVWFGPVLETFVLGLRRALRDFAAPEGTSVRLVIEGASGGSWVARRTDSTWLLGRDDLDTTTTVTMDQETAWRLFTKGISKDEATPQIRVTGDPALADRVLDTVSILA